MKDPQSLTLEEIEEFLLEPEGGKEEYNFTPQMEVQMARM